MSESYDGNKPVSTFGAINTWYTYSWIDNGHFYRLVPPQYRDYYIRFVKNWFYWYDGWVPYFHNSQSGIMSTRLAYTILSKLSSVVVGSKLMYDDEGHEDVNEIEIDGNMLSSVDFIEHWAHATKLDTKVLQGQEWAFAGGDSIIKLDSDGSNLRPSILRKDNYFINTDFKGEICEFTGLIYTYTKLVNQSQDGENHYYYLLEERKYDENGKPMFRIHIKEGIGSFTNNRNADISPQTVEFARLPRDVRHKFKKDYPKMLLGEWYEMPLKDLGIYMIKATESVSFLPYVPFGESLLSNLISYLMTYDFYHSSLVTNLYTARDKVILPQHMQTPNDSFDNPYHNYYSGFDSLVYERIPYTDPEGNKPVIFQPSTRAQEWSAIRDNVLQMVAMSLKVEERTLSSAIIPNAEKPTAREISADEYTTTLFAESKRALLKNALDPMLEAVLDFYGFDQEKVVVKFSKAGLMNLTNVSTIVSVLKDKDLIDIDTALEMIFVDKNNVQRDNIKNNIEADLEKKRQHELDSNVEKGIKEQGNNDINHVPKKE